MSIKHEEYMSIAQAITGIYLVISITVTVFGMVYGSIPSIKCNMNSPIKVLFPAWSVGCLLVKPFTEEVRNETRR